MLRYFTKRKDIPQVVEICAALNLLKKRISKTDFTDHRRELDSCSGLFPQIREIAVSEGCEQLANAQFLFREYFVLFSCLSQYFDLLSKKEFKLSWDKLQDCLDAIKHIRKFADDRLEVDDLYGLLSQYESLYPYTLFGSSEYVISKSHCSICGKSMQSLSCPHIRGNLYWGEPAIEVIDEIATVRAISIVEHPEDKRCILWAADDTRTEEEKFKKLSLFLEMQMPFLQQFTMTSRIELRKKEGLPSVGRNQKCPCGSGKKFKQCCGKDVYYKHERNIISPGKTIALIMV